MEDAAGRESMLLLGNLPEEIVAFEILVRLPPKAVLRCHAVCRAWRRIASAREFLLAHHQHQPSLHLAQAYNHRERFCHEILAIDHRAAQLQPVLQLSTEYVEASPDGSHIWLVASCDGILVYCIGETHFFVCNPATRQCVGLELNDFDVLALYLHRPTGEYRLLLRRSMPDDQTPMGCYVLTLGCDRLPRCIGKQEAASSSMCCTPVLVRGNLHWTWSYVQHQSSNDMVITVFDTVAESFWKIRAPMVALADAFLFEMDGMVGMYSCSEDGTIVTVWVMQDYDREVWSLLRQVKLPMEHITGHLEGSGSWGVKVTCEAGDLLVLVDFGRHVLHVDAQGKLLSSSECDGRILIASRDNLKLSLIRHAFFSRLQVAVNLWPFI